VHMQAEGKEHEKLKLTSETKNCAFIYSF
jgi:hypothetical protein